MAAPYDILSYLLDKENIRDTVLRLMLAFDERAIETLINQVYTPEITLNYDPLLLGGKPEKVPSETWAKRLEHMHDHYDTTQHIIQNLLIELPQPGAGGAAQRPDTATLTAYAHGYFYKRNDEGRPRVMALRNGARYDLELVRLEGKEGNPWRVSVQNVRLDWQDKGT